MTFESGCSIIMVHPLREARPLKSRWLGSVFFFFIIASLHILEAFFMICESAE
jgi:hypothetical protein